MDFRILGPLEVVDCGRHLRIGAAKQRAVLAILLLHANEVVAGERLIDELWGETPPRTAQQTLRVYISQLRKLLEPNGSGHAVVTEPAGYRLRLAADQLDASRFEALARDGGERLAIGDLPAAAQRLHEALGLWRGPALVDFRYEPFAQAESARLDELRLACLEHRIETDLKLGQAGDLVGELEALVAEHPWREGFRRWLMLALYQSGRQADALALFRETRRLFVDELGIEPSTALRDLHSAILAQDPALELAASFAPDPITAPRRKPAAARAARKLVSVLVCELDATGATDRLDPEALPRALSPYWALAAEVADRHGGTVEFVGDAVIAMFGIPRLHEDDALRAVRAAVELRDKLSAATAELEPDWGIGLEPRMAINSGEVVHAEGEVGKALVVGEPVATAARFAQAARPGDVLFGDGTHRLVAGAVRAEPLAPLRRGANAGVATVWRLERVLPSAGPISLHLDAPLVGRGNELARIRLAYARAKQREGLELCVIFGPAGIGKSRLAHEIAVGVAGEAQVLTGHCLPYGEGITFWPLREVVLGAFGPDPREEMLQLLRGDEHAAAIVDQVLAATGIAGVDVPVQDAPWAFRRLLEALGRRRQILLVLEDLHWAEPALLDLLQALSARNCEAPICLLGLTRPDLLDERPSFLDERPNVSVVGLDALNDEDADVLLGNLRGELELEDAVRARLLATAGGNPLFIEQLFAMIAEGLVLSEETALPLTIQALLATRLEGLGPGERAALERASIIGREFAENALVDLVPQEASGSLFRHLGSLIDKQLIRPERSSPSGEKSFAFRHRLIQETAYRSIPKEQRAIFHERFAAWLERTAGEDYDEIIGFHLEQAYRYCSELGPVREKERRLADRAGDCLERAGRRAYARGDARAAINLLERARGLLSRDGKVLACGLPLADARASAGEFEGARRLLAEIIKAAERSGDRRVEWLARVQYAQVSELVAPHDWTPERAKRTADKALRVFGESEDDVGLARAWTLAGRLAWNHCRFDEAANAYGEALNHARRAGAVTTEVQALNALVTAITFGSTPLDEARRRTTELVAQMPRLPAFEAHALLAIARQQALAGASGEARDLYLRATSIYDELGRAYAKAGAAVHCEEIALLAGDAEFAERELRAAYEVLERMGAESVRSTVAAFLGDALYALRRYDEAEEFARVSLEASAADDIASQSRARAVMAKVLAERGDHEAAEGFAQRAVELAANSDDLYSYAQMLVALAEVLGSAGREQDAVPIWEAAAEVSERKGDVVTAGRARARLVDLQPAS